MLTKGLFSALSSGTITRSVFVFAIFSKRSIVFAVCCTWVALRTFRLLLGPVGEVLRRIFLSFHNHNADLYEL